MINKKFLIKWSYTLAIQMCLSFLSFFDENLRNAKLVEQADVFPAAAYISISWEQYIQRLLLDISLEDIQPFHPFVSSVTTDYSLLLRAYNSVVSPLFSRVDFRGGKLDLMRDLMNQFSYE